MKKNQNKIKEKIKQILNSYKTIIYISFAINLALLVFIYSIITSNKIYSFSGSDNYLKVKDGIILFNTDMNLFNGNNLEYVHGEDYEITSYKIGYYVMDDKELVEIISTANKKLDTEIKISEIIKNFTSFNLSEKNGTNIHFTKEIKSLVEDSLYLVMEAKTKDGVDILSKVKLNVSKISKY